MNKLYLGKINLSNIDKAKIFEGKKGKWIDVTVWISEEPDQYGNHMSIQQSTGKEDPKIYLGNAKEFVRVEQPAQQQNSSPFDDIF